MASRGSRGWIPELLVRAAVRNPLQTLALWGALLCLVTVGVFRLDIDTTTDSVLDKHGPKWAFYQSAQKSFGGDEIIVVALRGARAFDAQMLAEVDRFTDQLSALEGVRRVDSLASVPAIRLGLSGDLELTPPLGGGASSLEVRRLVERDRIARRTLISEDGRTAAINVVLEAHVENYDRIVESVHEVVQGSDVWVSGVPIFRSAASSRTGAEILTFVPLTVIAMGLLVGFAYRSLEAAILALSIGGIGSFVMSGAMGFLGSSLSLVTMILPSVMLALGCAYVMHILSAARGQRGGADLEGRLADVALPVLLSSLTTAIGFSAIAGVPIDEVRAVGGFGALGALVLGFAALTVAPASIALRRGAWENRTCSALETRVTFLLVDAARRHRLKILACWLVALIGSVVGIKQLDVVTDATQWFGPGDGVRDSYDRIGEALSGISPVNVVVSANDGASVIDPGVLEAIDGLTDFLESLPQVGRALSIRDPLRQINGAFLGDVSMPLPGTERASAQYLLLLESVPQLQDLITPDRRMANILVRADDNSSGALLEIEDKVAEWWAAHAPAASSVQTTGIMYEFARAEDAIAFGQIRGLGMAVAAIGVTMLLALGSPIMAMISMIPNVIPTAMAFGLMGWSGIPLDAGTIVVGSLALGVAVDDTIHLVSTFHERVGGGAAAPVALERAIGTVLHPVTLTSVVIAVGFGILGLSGFTLTRNLGLVMAGVTVICLLADLLLLPTLLLAVGKRIRKGGA